MDQYLSNKQNEILWRLLANPADNGYMHSHNLQQLARDFPQSGLLQALYARSNNGGNMAHAAASFDPKTLYVLINAYENLAEVSAGQVISSVTIEATEEAEQSELATGDVERSEPIITEEIEGQPNVAIGDDERDELLAIQDHFEAGDSTETEPIAQVEETPGKSESIVVNEPIAELPDEDDRAELQHNVFEEEITDGQHTEELFAQINEEEIVPEPIIELPEENHMADGEDQIFEEIAAAPEMSRRSIVEEESIIEENIRPEQKPGIEDEIFDEIVGIENISFAFAEKPVAEIQDEAIPDPSAEPSVTVDEPADEPGYYTEIESVEETETEELVPESLASSDFFVFEKAEQITTHGEDEQGGEFVSEQSAIVEPAGGYKAIEADTKYVSKYHDEKMPYTFMWWLDKTRKEHSGIYQPFKLDTTQVIRHTADETLQQQYYENIFHVSTIEELDRSAAAQAVEFDMQRKEDRIIKKFIIEEPHISAPSSDKLDNENKARRSAEDQDELVTETLARIYVDQMLYHKAINTYKKLILKFPEKSRYFADQIEVLERKIN